MKKALFSLMIWLVSAVTLSAGTRVIPIAGHLPGANESSWTTDVSLSNNDSVANLAELVFHSDSGRTVSRTVTLAAGTSLLLADAVRPESFPGVNPSSWLGQLEIRSTGNISASARTFTSAKGGGTFGSAYESYDPAVLSSNGAMSGLINSPRYRSNIAYANSGGAIAIVNYTLRGEDGTMLATNQLTVPAQSTVQIPLARDIASSASGSRVMIEWSSTTPLYAIASVIDNFSNDPTNIPSSNGDTELSFPVVGRTAGALSTFWSTSAAISSRADVAGNVTFAYRDNGSGQLHTKTVSIAPRGTVTADDLNTFVGAGAGSGSLTVTSTVRVVSAVRVFNTLADGSTFGSALLPQDNAVRASRVLIKGVRRDAAYRLNVSVSSHSDATDGTIRLLDDSGQEVESEPFHTGPDSMTQVSLNRGEAEVHSGEVEVETHNGVSVTAVASTIDNSTGDTSVGESEQENERQHEQEIHIAPSTAAVGAPVSFSIGSGTGVASVLWSFGDGTTGSGISTTHTYASAGEFGVTADVTLTGGALVRSQEDVHVLSSGSTVSNGPIDFSWSPLAPAPGQQVTFSASSTSTGGSFKWKFPGDVRVSGAVAGFTFPSAGSFEVELELEHEGSTTTEHATHVVTVGGAPGGGNPSIDFNWSPAAPAAGQQVTFTASGGNGGAFVFKFPGDVRKTGNPVTFTFASAGSYEVELEQEKEGSVTLHVTRVVNVGGGSNGGGTIDFTWSPPAPEAGQSITFTASGGNGGTFAFKFPGDVRKTGSVVTFTFASAGSYEVELEQEKEGSATLHATHVVVVGTGTVGGGNPIDFTWSPSSPDAGQVVTFTASGGNGGAFVFKFPGNVQKAGSAVTFTFASAGSYEVELEQEKEGSVTLHVAHVVVVGGGSPGGGAVTSVDFTWSPASPHAGQTVTFTATSDGQPSGGSFFKWRMPDDSRPQGTSAMYTFAAPGTYTIRVQLEQSGLPSIEREKDVVVVP